MSTLHVTDAATAVSADQCAHVMPDRAVSDVIVVAFAGSPTRWLDQWQTTVDADLDSATVVVDDAAFWLAGDPEERIETAAPADADVEVVTVASPGNLTDVGVTLTEVLDTYDDCCPSLCFQSMTVLLQYAPLSQVCQFLHTLVGQLDRFGATGHFHLHADAHDDETVAKLRSILGRVRHDLD